MQWEGELTPPSHSLFGGTPLCGVAHEGAKRDFSSLHQHTLPHIILRTLWKCYFDVYGYDMCVLCHAWLTCVAWAMHRRQERGAPQLALNTPTTHLWQFSLFSIILACSEVPTTCPALHLFTGKDSGPAYIQIHSPVFISTPGPAPLLLCGSTSHCRGSLYQVQGKGDAAHVAQECLFRYCILVCVILVQGFGMSSEILSVSQGDVGIVCSEGYLCV